MAPMHFPTESGFKNMQKRGLAKARRALAAGHRTNINTLDRGDIVEQRCIKCSNMRPQSRYRGEAGCIDAGKVECNDCRDPIPESQKEIGGRDAQDRKDLPEPG